MATKSLETYLDSQLSELKSAGVFRNLAVVSSAQGPRATINGRQVINLASNNYLGFVTHPKLKEAAIRAVEAYGAGSGAVRTIVGTLELHQKLEGRIAEFKGTESCLVFQSGFSANAGVLGVLLEEGDLVISDALNHASVIDGIRLTKADRAVYKHCDMTDLEQVLTEHKGKHKKTLIVTDGVFSMDGDIAPLDSIAELAGKYGAITMVDDAHGSGVLGDHGRGTLSHFGIAHDRWDITVGTLSKAIGVLGGYVACSAKLRQLMEHRARPFLFSTSHPPAVTAAVMAAIELLDSVEGKVLIDRLWENTRYFKEGLSTIGFDTGISETPITPVMVGDEVKAMRFSDALFESDVFATGIAFPTVARGAARVRTIVSATHSRGDLAQALDIFASVGERLQII